MNTALNTSLANLLSDLSPRPGQARPGAPFPGGAGAEKSAQKPGTGAAAGDLAGLLESAENADAAELEQATSKLLNRLLDGLISQKGKSTLAERAKNTPLSKSIAKDLSELIARLKNDAAAKPLAAKLEALLNPANARALEASLANSGVFYESRLRAALSNEALPKSVFRLINLLKNLRSPQLREQILRLADGELGANESIEVLEKFLDAALDAARKSLNGRAQTAARGAAADSATATGSAAEDEAADGGADSAADGADGAGSAKNTGGKNLSGRGAFSGASGGVSAAANAAANAANSANAGDSAALVRFAKQLANAANYLAKSPERSAQAAAAIERSLGENLARILSAAGSESSINKLFALAKELKNFTAGRVLSAVTGGQNQPASAGQSASTQTATAQAATAQTATAQTTSAPAGYENLSAKLPPSSPAAEIAKALKSCQNAPEAERQATLKTIAQNFAKLAATAAAANATGTTAGTTTVTATTATSTPTAQAAQNPAKSAEKLAGAAKSAANMLRAALAGDQTLAKADELGEIRTLRSLLARAKADTAAAPAAPDLAELQNDAKALLLRASEHHDPGISRLANKALAQLELNQLISVANAEIFTHLPYDYEDLKHASVGFRADGGEKFSAQIKLDFARFGRVNVMLALHDEKYLHLSAQIADDALLAALSATSGELKRSLRAAGLVLAGFSLRRLQKSDYESDEGMKMGLNLRI